MHNTRKILSSLLTLAILGLISWYVARTTDVRGTLKSAIIEPYSVQTEGN